MFYQTKIASSRLGGEAAPFLKRTPLRMKMEREKKYSGEISLFYPLMQQVKN